MNRFLLDPATIQTEWRQFRKTLTQLPEKEQLEQTFEFWRSVPIMSSRQLDWDAPETWPDPWQMIAANKYDESSVALAIFYTLMYATDTVWANRIYLSLISDQSSAFQSLAVIIDNCYVACLPYQEILEFSNETANFRLHQSYVFFDRQHRIA